jgi:hypothetical protein
MLHSDRYKSVTAVTIYKEGAFTRVGTAFFLSSEGRLHLVTCRHVILAALQAITSNETVNAVGQRNIFLRLSDNDGQSFRNCQVALYDSFGNRRWRSFLDPENVWDVAIIELDQEDFSAFAISAWTEQDLLPANVQLDQGTKIVVLTFPEDYRSDSPPCDFPTTVDLEEHQIFASDRGAIIKESFYPGASGSVVYKTIVSPDSFANSSNTSQGMTMQLVGVFTGAFPRENPQAGHFHYIDTAAEIIRSRQDCLDDEGMEFRDDGLFLSTRSKYLQY